MALKHYFGKIGHMTGRHNFSAKLHEKKRVVILGRNSVKATQQHRWGAVALHGGQQEDCTKNLK